MLPEGYVEKKRGAVRLVVRKDLLAAVETLGVFEGSDPAGWQGAGETLAGGRAAVRLFRLENGEEVVVKMLRRGGIMRFLNPLYHLSAKRIFQEVRLAEQLLSQNVPVVPVLFGRAERSFGFLNRLHLGTEEVKKARSLFQLLETENEDSTAAPGAFQEAGRGVRALHEAGVYHHDLNLGNLLVRLEAGQPVPTIIDLDRSVMRDSLPESRRLANLARLYRHAVKYRLTRHSLWETCWRGFLTGYGGDEETAGRLEAGVNRVFQRALPLHRLSWWLQGK